MQEKGGSEKMESLLMRKKLYQVDIPPETQDQWEQGLKISREKWGRYFRNEEEFEFFSMLPLSDKDKCKLLMNLKEESQQKQKLRNCKGEHGQTKEHRSLCLSCVLVDKSARAEPFY